MKIGRSDKFLFNKMFSFAHNWISILGQVICFLNFIQFNENWIEIEWKLSGNWLEIERKLNGNWMEIEWKETTANRGYIRFCTSQMRSELVLCCIVNPRYISIQFQFNFHSVSILVFFFFFQIHWKCSSAASDQ